MNFLLVNYTFLYDITNSWYYLIPLYLYASIAIIFLMNKIFLDACSLIYLTKIQIKRRLPQLGEVFIGPSVKNEVIAEFEEYPNAQTIRENIEKNIIKELKKRVEKLPELSNLGIGEMETIELCLQETGIFVTDDHQALNYAISRGLKPKTSEVILLDFLTEDIIELQEFKTLFKKLALIKSLKPEIVEFFIQKANEIKKKEKNE